MLSVNTYNAASVSRRQNQNVTNFVTMSSFWNLVTTFGILNEKCIQKSPNMSGIGSLIREIDIKISEI